MDDRQGRLPGVSRCPERSKWSPEQQISQGRSFSASSTPGCDVHELRMGVPIWHTCEAEPHPPPIWADSEPCTAGRVGLVSGVGPLAASARGKCGCMREREREREKREREKGGVCGGWGEEFPVHKQRRAR